MSKTRGLPLAVVMLLGLLSLAPTPGDIGGCGQPAEDLDPGLFYAALAATDCRACQSCGLATLSCGNACDGAVALPTGFPKNCAPLAHDGEVCLRRLQSASCDEYQGYVADAEGGQTATITERPRPSECQFCPPR